MASAQPIGTSTPKNSKPQKPAATAKKPEDGKDKPLIFKDFASI
ncbi:hypothetical protein SAMN04488515_0909 [Cognatiyoonia koreensis]|uniref:Uncharacterized protein n=1 Tax=Cognatiyoonia koreensis TaxID=364200 RepID=A0A1I0NYX7_9RHOB|nr:hypothetical protein [Cognatiyoonia koreensis]SEW07083.1 hypothetical protein SAMN04488515_0909 [Cognatiyoonia koreensis]